MEIERLSFVITPEDRVGDFIDADTKVWEPWLRQQKGYLRKSYQRYPEGRVDIRIFWATQRDLATATRNPELPSVEVRLRSEFLGVFTRLP